MPDFSVPLNPADRGSRAVDGSTAVSLGGRPPLIFNETEHPMYIGLGTVVVILVIVVVIMLLRRS
jgi:hypothetical protein